MKSDMDKAETLSQEESAPVTKLRVARKEPCPCGSQKKFKNCCIGNPSYELIEDTPPPSAPVPAAGQAKGRGSEKPFKQAVPKPPKSFKASNVVHRRRV